MSTEVAKSKRILYLDVLIATAAFAVVALHANRLVHGYVPTMDWAQALVAECIFYWAVPIFFMSTGINLMRYRERYDTKTFFLKRGLKALIPFLVWALIAHLVFLVIRGGIGLADFSIGNLYEAIFFFPHMGIYWFFFPLFGIYLSMPVLSLLKDNKKVLWYIVGLGVATFSLLPMLCALVGVPFNESLRFPLTGGAFIIFSVLGYLLANTEIPKKWRIVIYLAGLAGLLFRYIFTYVMSTSAGVLNNTLFAYEYLPSVLLAVAVFVFFKQVNWERIFKGKLSLKLLRTITACSLGIYLVHFFLIVGLLPKFGWTPDMLITRTLGVVVCFVISLIFVWLLKKIPVVKNIVP